MTVTVTVTANRRHKLIINSAYNKSPAMCFRVSFQEFSVHRLECYAVSSHPLHYGPPDSRRHRTVDSQTMWTYIYVRRRGFNFWLCLIQKCAFNFLFRTTPRVNNIYIKDESCLYVIINLISTLAKSDYNIPVRDSA